VHSGTARSLDAVATTVDPKAIGGAGAISGAAA
jgi:hypothetical protein